MESSFWTETCRYGAIHRTTKAANSRCLVVFVHGLFGDSLKTWGKMPEWVLTKAGVNCDVISFDYPSKPWERSSLEQAGDDLAVWLDNEFKSHRHIIFITHSTGGLVVKQLLSNAFSAHIETGLDQQTLDYPSNESLWFKTRRVLNIAVPHQGGDPLTGSLGHFAYQGLYPLAWPALALTRLVTQGKKDFGKNDLIASIYCKNKELRHWEAEFLHQQRRCKAAFLPYPKVQDISAKSDLSVRYQASSHARQIFFRGTHKSIKIPKRINAPIVSIAADIVRLQAQDLGPMLVDETLKRIVQVNQKSACTQLIEPAGNSTATPPPTINGAHVGCQQDIVNQVIKLLQKRDERPRQLVITGKAGVGKSFVCRMIAWHLGCHYLSTPAPPNPLVLFIPLQQVTFENQKTQEFDWERLWQWWLKRSETLSPELNCDRNWLEETLLKKPTTLILDGLDDFLSNHANLGIAQIQTLLHLFNQRYAHNTQLTIVISLRSSTHGLERLARSQGDIFEIQALTADQAQVLFPACRDWVATLEDNPHLLEQVLTPAILAHYQPDPGCQLGHPEIPTQSSIFCQTLRGLLARNPLIGTLTPTQQFITVAHLGQALAIIAWLFFVGSRGTSNSTALNHDAKTHRKNWEAFFEHNKQSNSDWYYRQIEPHRGDILTSLSIIEHPANCQALLENSVFIPTDSVQFRFMHQQWQDFLLAQFFVTCLQNRHFEPLGHSAFPARIFRLAGDNFTDTLTDSFIEQLLSCAKQQENPYILGNVIAFLAWTTTALEAPAIRLLLSQTAQFNPLSRLVLIGGLAHRVLNADPNDTSLTDLRRQLVPVLIAFANPETAPTDDPVATSMSWYYAHALAQKQQHTKPEQPLPTLDFSDATTEKVLPVICTVNGNELTLDNRSRSFQIALLGAIADVFNNPQLIIRALHYLYYLLVAQKHGIHSHEVSVELPPLLTPGCAFEQLINASTLTPQLATLYSRCQQCYLQIQKGISRR